MNELPKDNRSPRKWVTKIYQTLAVGRYALHWLPELLILYSIIQDEDGDEAAKDWLLKELALAVKPSMAHRLYLIYRVVSKLWDAFNKIARD
ncbi:hypothetical protein NS365_22020 [Aureimonas ureilytica]|uniref:Uncharacterized protein n=1 Tax=Aureimonas ureilytica TaxID=401562 RepID=A0A175RHI8_9HYPH|nr:hypothetical protein [Aureimonas ureilytica]KTR02289.1 hypothetical protein NS365_22020 [Aureimonas ureilytica]